MQNIRFNINQRENILKGLETGSSSVVRMYKGHDLGITCTDSRIVKRMNLFLRF